MSLNFKVETQKKPNGEYMVIIHFRNPRYLNSFIENFERFMIEYQKFLLREKMKKETGWGYFSVSGSGNRRT